MSNGGDDGGAVAGVYQDLAEPRPTARRKQVMDAARCLFLTRGFHATGIAQIAKNSGVHVVQIYRDFGSKEGIVAAIAEDEVKASMEAAALAASGASGIEGFRRWLRAHLERQCTPDLFLEIIAEAARNPRIAAVLQEIAARSRPALIEAFARHAPGTPCQADLEVQADLLITLTSGLHSLTIGHPNLDKQRLVARIEAVLEREIFGAAAYGE